MCTRSCRRRATWVASSRDEASAKLARQTSVVPPGSLPASTLASRSGCVFTKERRPCLWPGSLAALISRRSSSSGNEVMKRGRSRQMYALPPHSPRKVASCTASGRLLAFAAARAFSAALSSSSRFRFFCTSASFPCGRFPHAEDANGCIDRTRAICCACICCACIRACIIWACAIWACAICACSCSCASCSEHASPAHPSVRGMYCVTSGCCGCIGCGDKPHAT
mmetsp:Transcript_12860/g.27726  ORF Transcript_12860/g.27726 Transcript_12860/m.27726 type:complete len:225 (+) Transcript_12860:844-1518(+)